MTFSSRRIILVTWGALFGTVGCSPAGSSPVPIDLGQDTAPISGGMEAPQETGTVAFVNTGDKGAKFCSAALIAPNLVATARHCVSSGAFESCADSMFQDLEAASEVFVFGVPSAPFDGPPPTYTDVLEILVPEPQTEGCGYDIALLVLASEVVGSDNEPYTPRVDGPVSDGEAYAAVGYGGTNDAGDGVGTRRKRDGLTVQCLGAECDAEGVLPGSLIHPNEFYGESGSCAGDSGGPALDDAGRVIGLYSRGLAMCQSPIYTDIHAWAAFVKETAAHAAEVGAYDPAPWVDGGPTDPSYGEPLGGPCSENADCPSGICIEQQCSRPCVELAPCDDGWTCEDEVCVPPSAEQPDPMPEPESQPSNGASSDEGGCTMSTPSSPPAHAAWLAAALGVLVARRRRLRVCRGSVRPKSRPRLGSHRPSVNKCVKSGASS